MNPVPGAVKAKAIDSPDGNARHKYGRSGRGVDTSDKSQPFYDQIKNAVAIMSPNETSIFDRPTSVFIGTETVENHPFTGKRFTLGKQTVIERASVADAYLVCNGEVYYQVHWEFRRTKSGGNWNDPEYTNIYGQPVNGLPLWAIRHKLPSGYYDDELKKKRSVPNPVSPTSQVMSFARGIMNQSFALQAISPPKAKPNLFP